MPIIAYLCENNHFVRKFYRKAKEAPKEIECSECGQIMKKTLSAPSSTSKITIDNGLQARAVEIHPDIVEINEERSNKNYRED